jgi:hypothetical protein
MGAGKFGSQSVVYCVDGYDLLATKVKNLTHKIASATERTDGLGDGAEANGPVGMVTLTLTQGGGFFDTSANNAHTALGGGLPSGPQSTPRLVLVGFAGNDVGQPIYGIDGMFQSTYQVDASIGALTKANAEYIVKGALDKAVILQPLAAKTADWNTKTDGDEVDYADDTTQRVIPITSNSAASPSVVTTPVPHGLATGDKILISGVEDSDADINGEQTVTVISDLTFSVAVDASTHAGTGGSFVRTNSANGAAGYLMVKSMAGITSVTVKIRDSADNTTYADLITFTAATAAPAKERKTVTGQVDRFLCVDGDVTGTGSITPIVALARL